MRRKKPQRDDSYSPVIPLNYRPTSPNLKWTEEAIREVLCKMFYTLLQANTIDSHARLSLSSLKAKFFVTESQWQSWKERFKPEETFILENGEQKVVSHDEYIAQRFEDFSVGQMIQFITQCYAASIQDYLLNGKLTDRAATVLLELIKAQESTSQASDVVTLIMSPKVNVKEIEEVETKNERNP